MNQVHFTTGVSEELADAIVRSARTSLSDTLRSVVYFTPDAFDVLYTRSDLYDSDSAARAAKAPLVEFEVAGFAEAPVRSAVSSADVPMTIGPYEFTVRFYADGFVVRVLGDDAGVLMTTDSMNVNEFSAAASAMRSLLGDGGDELREE